MRNPKRISKFCNELAKIWEINCPDWRFGQLICNVFGELACEIDPFFPEDDRMIEFFRNYFNNDNKENEK